MTFERIYNIGNFLLDCACDSLMDTEAGCPERHCLVPGVEPEHVNCCEGGGQLTVNVLRSFPSRQFPVPDLNTPSNCDAPYTVVTYNVEIIRCSPLGSIDRAPSCADLDRTAKITMEDHEAIRNGIACCLKDDSVSRPVMGAAYRWAFGDHLSVQPEGGCTGSNLSVQVGYQTCLEC